MKQGHNDWNVPDWRDASAYPPQDTPRHVWAWEFLRRNPKYRQLWTEATSNEITNLDAPQQFGLAIWHDPRVKERGKGHILRCEVRLNSLARLAFQLAIEPASPTSSILRFR